MNAIHLTALAALLLAAAPTLGDGGQPEPPAEPGRPRPVGWWLAAAEEGRVLSDAGPGGLDGEIHSASVGRDASAPSGSALVFDGADDAGLVGPGGFATVPAPAGFSAASGFAIALWTRLDATAAFSPIATMAGDYETLGGGFCLYAADGTLGAFVVSPEEASGILRGPSAPTNVWAHLCLSSDGAVASLFVNGTLAATATNALAETVAESIALGTVVGVETAYPFAGAVADVRLFGRALSQSDAAALASEMGAISAEAADGTPSGDTAGNLAASVPPDIGAIATASATTASSPAPRNPCVGIRRRPSLLRIATPLE